MEKVVQSLAHQVENFLLTKKLAGCTDKTLEEYQRWLDRFTLRRRLLIPSSSGPSSRDFWHKGSGLRAA